MTMITAQVSGITRRAFSDHSLIPQAQAELTGLARQTTDPAELAEIQDAGTMLSRLAGSLVQNKPVTGIFDQLQGQT